MFKVSQDIHLNSNNSNSSNNLNYKNYEMNLSTENAVSPIFNSDITKITCNGNGLNKIQINTQNEFIIDASNAGNNILFVGICGPNGQCDEVSIKHLGKHIYHVHYQVKETGMYIIVAKWGDDHIPGSPFNVMATV